MAVSYTHLSGNIGATNAYRELGLKAAAAVFICDFLKGVLAVWIGGSTPLLALACATAAIVGNDWSVFLHFKSGKGVACGVGAFTFICPWATLSAFVVWLLVFLMTRIVSLASIVAAPVVVLVIYLAHMPMEYVIFLSLIHILKQGNILGIFPEGTRIRKDGLGRFHSGMASIAMMAGVDILPIAVLNSRELPHTTEPPAVLIGRPIHVKKQKPDKASIEAINQQVRAAIEQMAEEYRNRQKN